MDSGLDYWNTGLDCASTNKWGGGRPGRGVGAWVEVRSPVSETPAWNVGVEARGGLIIDKTYTME